MLKITHFLIPALVILFLSCKNEHGYTYAIKDFRKPLQPYLFRIVSRGIVMYYDSSLRYIATGKELNELSESEHPVLRASAFREMLHRKPADHFDILMNHLDDTADVATDAGEFGIWHRTVSDDILDEAVWKTRDEKNKTIELVLTKHNYLRSAYFILLKIEPQEKYYSLIKDMATRPRRLSVDGDELDFYDIEYALYGLAKFKRKDDIEIIKDKMMQHVWELSNISFRILQEFPDTSYFDILQTYHRRRFYKFSGNRREGFSGVIADRADPEDFIHALIVQQSDKSAQLLDTMLHRLPLRPCMPDRDNITDEIIKEIWNNPCPAYARLREKIKSKAKEILKGEISIPIDSLRKDYDISIDTTKEVIHWYF
ncbi:MAG TPA: SPASM domain-containing protein [Puia sp.]|nr:SPASM domain-containing protein [Puia sp.]